MGKSSTHAIFSGFYSDNMPWQFLTSLQGLQRDEAYESAGRGFNKEHGGIFDGFHGINHRTWGLKGILLMNI